MNNVLHIDLETGSRTNLITDGLYNYATDPSTFIHCMCWAFGDGEINLWTPDQPFPRSLKKYIETGVPLLAHNAGFERMMFEYVICPDFDVPEPKLEQWFCTSFQARCNNLPASLYNGARCLGIPQQKSKRGQELIKLLSIPQENGEFYSTPELLEEFYAYCDQDVVVERALHAAMREPTPEEWQDYHVNERINDRGIRLDRELCDAAQIYAADEEQELLEKIDIVSHGAVNKARGEGLKKWVLERLTPDQQKILVKHRKGEKLYSLDKHNRGRLLSLEDLDADVREVVECSDFAQRSSVGKFHAMSNRADPEDDRIRGAFLANGASQSGRYSSRGLQCHNFPRTVMENPVECRADFIDEIMAEDIRDYFELPIMDILSRMLRPALIPAEGKKFLVSDWSSIEGRVGPWLADSPAGEAKLDQYRAQDAGTGKDVYILAAEAIFGEGNVKEDSHERQVGKVAELALGFGGGAGAFLGMGRNYGVSMDKDRANQIKEVWRKANPWAEALWSGCEEAAMAALTVPNQRYTVGRVSYFAVPNVLVGEKTLFCELPCGRLLTYPDARVEMRETPWGAMVPGITALRAAWTPKATERQWPRADLWGGLLQENNTQGFAASLLRYALREADRKGLPTVMHIHDELIVETSKIHKLTHLLFRIMNTAFPEWANGLPLTADVKVMDRFGK